MQLSDILKLADVPRYGDDAPVDLPHGYRLSVKTEYDDTMGEPWKEHDGHGPVSDWTTRTKRPGEWVLVTDRSHRRYYDAQAAQIIALNDGWDAPPYGTGTKRERAARAVRADFENLRGWCNDEWHWLGVIVTVYFRGEEVGSDSLWGIESYTDYWRECAFDMAGSIIDTHLIERKHKAQKARIERNERRYWAARDVATIGGAA